MDDGLQNPHLEKNVKLLVIDGAVGFGNGRLIPAGPLREAVAPALADIDAVIVIGEDRADIGVTLPPSLPCFSANFEPVGDQSALRGRRVLAFAGIGRPEKFFETLKSLGADLVETRSFPDHHRYDPAEIEKIRERARQFDAALITTEKDHVRLPPMLGKYVEKLSVRLLVKALSDLDRLLANALDFHAATAK
jgi:tetraacyldisaccharide 4'-kinase